MGLAFSSCDSYLDLEPQSVLTPDNAYQTPSDWEKALYGAYGSLQEVFVGKWTITLGEFGTDEV
ncbi:MAG: RagB/SusD family nutrient uptake outer membrane protein, partial [Muribaculaceae bacterium]|nr:RagB/SusD family nutrient uptake outer membrane protein [Muribaculaceae bacterium]